VIDGAGHMPQMERPAEVQAAIEESIARAADARPQPGRASPLPGVSRPGS